MKHPKNDSFALLIQDVNRKTEDYFMETFNLSFVDAMQHVVAIKKLFAPIVEEAQEADCERNNCYYESNRLEDEIRELENELDDALEKIKTLEKEATK